MQYTLCFNKFHTLFVFAITPLILNRFRKFLAQLHSNKFATKCIFYFSPHPFYVPVRWLVKRTTQFYTIPSGKRQIQSKKLVAILKYQTFTHKSGPQTVWI